MKIATRGLWLALALPFLATLQAQTPQACLEALEAHQGKRFEQAAGFYRDCLAVQPGNFPARSNLGAVLAQMGRFADAIDSYRQALTIAPPEAMNPLRRNLALAFYKSGQVPAAERELTQVHAAEPEDRQTLLLLADCYLLTGEPAKTVKLLESDIESGDPAVEYLLGTALIRSGDAARGKTVIDRILRRSDSAEAHLLLGAALFAGQDYPAAANELARSLKIDPNLPSANSYYGQALLTMGDADGATGAFRKELALNPNDFEANLQLGQILSARHKTQEAVPFLERAALIRPGSMPAAGSAPQANDGPPVGAAAPEISLVKHGSPGRIALSGYRDKSPVLLIFASYSCPQFRAQVEKLNAFYERYGNRLPFLLVYIREAHAGTGWQSSINVREGIDVPEPKTEEQRQANADLCLRKLKIRFSAAVDDLTGQAEKAYAAWPSRVYLVNAAGRIAYQTRLDEQSFDADALEKALKSAFKTE